MRVAVILLLIAVHTSANAWFFFFIPGSGGGEDTFCVTEGQHLGTRVTIPNKGTGVVTGLHGTSFKCRDNRYPIRATVDFNAQPVAVAPQSTPVIANFQPPPTPPPAVRGPDTFTADKCTYASAKEGSGFYDARSGNGTVYRVVGASDMCPTAEFPLRVVVTFSSKPAVEPSAESAAPSPSAAKLRELAAMLKEGLITQDDYEAKKQELLKNF